MAIIHGEIDSLKNLIHILKRNKITHVQTLDDVLTYKNVCNEKIIEAEAIARQEHYANIALQKELITKHILGKEPAPPHGSCFRKKFESLVFRYRLFILNRELRRLEKKSEKIIRQRISKIAGSFLKSKNLLDMNFNLIQGTRGEQQALDELKKLPDSYYVINNFQMRFSRPIYNPKTRQRIYSIQADHIVLGPSGLFLIETKNWSQSTIKKVTDFTPIQQIKRTSFALFCYLNPRSDGFFSWFTTPKKISVRSILLMTSQTISERDPFVKVLNLLELCSYISHFPTVMTDIEIKNLLNRLIR